ncbi:MAG: hypothetical protein EON51_17895 [Acinetobacter sp.]|nr:MAG: hypothetical protein EON51_17895 [Acinetobacter sp.]
MTTLNYKIIQGPFSERVFVQVARAIILLLLWFTLPKILALWQPTVGLLDAGIWQLVLLSLLCFLALLSLSWWLLNRYWQILRLPDLHYLVSQFKTLTPWQQSVLYWASFALLFLGGLLSLAAIF